MFGGAGEVIAGIAIVLFGILLWVVKEYGASQAIVDEKTEDLKQVSKIMKEAEDAAKTRAEAEYNSRTGNLPDRLRKHYID